MATKKKKTMSMRAFVREHRAVIDNTARAFSGDNRLRLNDEDREEWVLNDVGLYNLACSLRVEGTKE